MKKVFSILMVLLALMAFVGCSGSTSPASEEETQVAAGAIGIVFSYYYSEFLYGGNINVNESNFSYGDVSGSVKLDGSIAGSPLYSGNVNVEASLVYIGHDIDISGNVHVAKQRPDCSNLTILVDNHRVSGSAVNDILY